MEFQDILVCIIVGVSIVLWGVSLVKSLAKILSSRKKSGGEGDCSSGRCDGKCDNCR